jgi:actin-related protein
MARNIVLTGGNTLLKGFDERLLTETRNACNKSMTSIANSIAV